MRISRSEVDILILLCETTFDAFDGDGDGVPDVDDAFPTDPDESKDTDGDGVGDNADLAPSIANDLIYSAGVILVIGLLAMLVLVSRGSRDSRKNDAWDSSKQYNLAEQMLNLHEQPSSEQKPIQIVQESFNYDSEIIQNSDAQTNLANNNNLFEELLKQPDSPPQQLLGMIDGNGIESVEYPVNSGIRWQRSNPQQQWKRV